MVCGDLIELLQKVGKSSPAFSLIRQDVASRVRWPCIWLAISKGLEPFITLVYSREKNIRRIRKPNYTF